MKKKRADTLAQWLERLPGLDGIPFKVDRRGLYRIADLYKGYGLRKPESWVPMKPTTGFPHRFVETLRKRSMPSPMAVRTVAESATWAERSERFKGRAAAAL